MEMMIDDVMEPTPERLKSCYDEPLVCFYAKYQRLAPYLLFLGTCVMIIVSKS